MFPAYVRCELGAMVMGNTWLERRLITRAGEPCVTESFTNQQSRREYLRPASHEFSLSANGQAMTAQQFLYVHSEVREGEPVEAVIHLGSSMPALTLELHFQIYSAHPVIRKWMVIKNLGTELMTLSDLDWEDLNLLIDTPATAEVWVDYFTRREKAVVGTMDDCALLVNDTLHQEGFIIASEAPGPLKRLEAYAQRTRVAVGYNRDDETIFERLLAPGESFRTPASFILTFANPIPQDVIDGAYARFVAEHLTICDVTRVPSITINTWQPHEFAIHRALLLDQLDRAAELGVDAYQVDAGWYDRMGDWNDDRTKFPNGLEEIAEHARSRGMRFGLWMAVATVDEASQLRREHPEWLARDRHGAPNRHPIPGAQTMCLDSDYYDFILDKIDGVIGRYGVELLKLDLSVVRNLYAPGSYAGCCAAHHAHRSPRESHVRIMERLFDLIRTLKQRHPTCSIDLSYELYGVMDGTDLALTQVADQNWFSNISSPNEINLRREIYQRGRVTRPWTLNFGGTALDQPSAPGYGLFSTLTAHAMFWGDLAKIDAETQAHYRRWFDWIKAQRVRSDFYRYHQVSDVFPVPDGVSSRDYRHAAPAARYGIAPRGIHPPAFDPGSEHPGEFWDGVARLDPRGEGPIFLFRPAASRDERFRLRMPWLERSARYQIDDIMDGRTMGVFDAEELIERGIEVYVAEPRSAKVIVLRRADKIYRV